MPRSPGLAPAPTPVHHYTSAERPAVSSSTPDSVQRLPMSLQQPLLTEQTLQKIPETSIDTRDEDDEVESAEAASQAVVPASDRAGLLFPAAIASLFCRSGQPEELGGLPSASVVPNGTSLHPYPRELLTIVSNLRGHVTPGHARADDHVVSPVVGQVTPEVEGEHVEESGAGSAVDDAAKVRPAWEESVVVTALEGAQLGNSSKLVQEVEPTPVAVAQSYHSAQPVQSAGKPDTTSLAISESLLQEQVVQSLQVNPPWGELNPQVHHTRSPVVGSRQTIEPDNGDEGAKSDTSTVTAESETEDAPITALADDDDRMSVVSTGSTWSDISGFEEDIWRLRSVLRDPTAPPEPVPTHLPQRKSRSREPPPPAPQQPPVSEQQQLQLHRLQLQLQHASQERDLYRGQLEALQGQMTAGSQRQHFEVRRQKAHLEGLLEMTRRELEEVGADRAELRAQLNKCQLELHAATGGSVRAERDALLAELTPLRVRARDTDAQLSEARGKLEIRDAELTAAKDELRRAEVDVTAARVTLEQAKREAETRDASVVALKGKVAELVAEAQRGLQERLTARSTVSVLREELQQRERSRDWYRSQLRAAHEERLQQQQALTAAHTELMSQRGGAEKLRGELALAKQAAAAVQTRAVREKESLLRHLENIQADMLQREALLKSRSERQLAPQSQMLTAASQHEVDAANSAVRNLQLKVQELDQQLEKTREDAAAADATHEQQEKLHQQIRFALAASQEKLSQQNKLFETLKQRSDENAQELDQLRAQLKESAASRRQLSEEKTRLEVALASANQEKRDVDDAARRLSVELKKVSASFYKLKNDVSAKEKQVEGLQATLTARESELRAANDRLDEADKLKQQAERVAEKMRIFDSMNEQNKQLMVTNHELRYKTQQLTQDRAVLDQGRQRLEEVVRNLQQQVNETVQREEQTKTALNERIAIVRELEEEKFKGKQELAAVKAYAKKLQHRKDSQSEMNEPVIENQTLAKSLPLESSLVQKSAQSDVHSVNNEEDQNGNASEDQPLHDSKTTTALMEPMSHQISLLTVQNRELERRLASLSASSARGADADTSAERVASLLQENAALTSQVASLTSHLHRLETDAENYRRAAAQRQENNAQTAEVAELREQLQLSQTRNKQLQQQLATAKRASEPAASSVPATDHSGITDPDPAGSDAYRRLSEELAATKASYREKHRCYQSNIRVLTRKLREYMKALKSAERQLAELRSASEDAPSPRTVELEEEAEQQRRRLEAAQRDTQRVRQQADQLRARADDAQLLALELEKERGRLEGMAQSYTALQRRAAELEALVAGYEEQQLSQQQESPAELRQLQDQLQQLQQQLQQTELEAREMRRQLFGERREVSRLKRDMGSQQSAVQTAEELAQTRQTQASEAQTALEQARQELADARTQIAGLRASLESTQRQAAEVRRQAEQSAANDPVLAQQIKTLSGHLHQKNAELKGMQEQTRLVEQRHISELDAVRSSLLEASEEAHQLSSRLDATRQEKFTLQTQVTELRAALQASADQSKELRTQISALESRLSGTDRSLVLPSPSPLDEELIRRLLEQSAPAAEPRPLDDLQACLTSLKQEMSALQSQIQQTEPWTMSVSAGNSSTGASTTTTPSPAMQPSLLVTSQLPGPAPVTSQLPGPAPVMSQSLGSAPMTSELSGPAPVMSQSPGSAPMTSQLHGPAPATSQSPGPAPVTSPDGSATPPTDVAAPVTSQEAVVTSAEHQASATSSDAGVMSGVMTSPGPAPSSSLNHENSTASDIAQAESVDSVMAPVEQSSMSMTSSAIASDNTAALAGNSAVAVSSCVAENYTVAVDHRPVLVGNAGGSVDNATISVDNAGVWVDNATVSVDNTGVSVDNAGVSVDNAGVSVDNATVSVDDATVSVGNPGVSVDNAEVSVYSAGGSVDNGGVSVDNAELSVYEKEAAAVDLFLKSTSLSADDAGSVGATFGRAEEDTTASVGTPTVEDSRLMSYFVTNSGKQTDFVTNSDNKTHCVTKTERETVV